MAERDDKKNGNSNSNSGNGGGSRLSAVQAIKAVREELPALLGRPIEAVLGVERSEEDGWVITVQVVELERIPRTTDVLAAYQATLDTGGELVGYRRRRRYTRGQVDSD